MQDRKSRSRSRSPRKGESSTGREERKREKKKRTGWDVGAEEGAAGIANFGLSQALVQQQNSLLMQGLNKGVQPGAAATQLLGLGASSSLAALQNSALMQNQRNMMCRIYVGSLDYYLTELEIKSVFQAFGTIVSVDMPKEGDRSKGFCFVEYASPEAAEMALSTMQNFVLKGRTIKVGRPTAVGTGGQQLQRTMMMPTVSPVGGVASSPAAVAVMNSAQAGAAAATAILAGRSGTGDSSNLASLLSTNQTPVLTPDQQLMQQQLLQQQQQVANNRVYIGNVPFGFSSEDLKKIFVVFGPILSCQLLPSQENPQQHRGYGFIEYATAEAAKLAIETMNGFEVAGKQLKVNFATAMRNSSVATAQMISPLATAAGLLPGLTSPAAAAALGISPLPGGGGAVVPATANFATTPFTNPTAPSSSTLPTPPTTTSATAVNNTFLGSPPAVVATNAPPTLATPPAPGAAAATTAATTTPPGTSIPTLLPTSLVQQPLTATTTAASNTTTASTLMANSSPGSTAFPPPPHSVSSLQQQTPSASSVFNGEGKGPTTNSSGGTLESSVVSSGSSTRGELKEEQKASAAVATGAVAPHLLVVEGGQAAGGLGGGCGVVKLPPVPTDVRSPVMLLTNMVSPQEVDGELKDEVREECSKFGSIKRVEVHPLINDVRIFVEFTDISGAAAAIPSLHGRWFGGRQIIAATYDQNVFLEGNYDA